MNHKLIEELRSRLYNLTLKEHSALEAGDDETFQKVNYDIQCTKDLLSEEETYKPRTELGNNFCSINGHKYFDYGF